MNKLCKPYICKNAFADDVADGIYDCKIKTYVGLMVFNNQIEVKHNKINTNDIKDCVQTFRKTFKDYDHYLIENVSLNENKQLEVFLGS